MQTLEVVSARAKDIGSISAGRKKLLLLEIPSICEALDRIKMQRVKKPGNAELSAADRIAAGKVQRSHILPEKTGQAVENAEQQDPVLLKQEPCLYLRNLAVVYFLQLITDLYPDRALHPATENPEPDAPRIIPIKTDQPVSGATKAIAVEPGALDSKPKRNNASSLPALKLKAADAIDSINAVFRREAYPASCSGFIFLQDAVSKVRNYHDLGKLKGRILNIKG